MAWHISLIRQISHDYPARKWKIEVDSEDISDRYILWEALNIRSVGPALSLAGRASTKDDVFDLVCVGESDRSALMEYLEARLAGQKAKLSLPIRKFGRLKTMSKKSTIHLDDTFWASQKEAIETSERNRNHSEAIRANYSATSCEFELLKSELRGFEFNAEWLLSVSHAYIIWRI